MGIDIVSWRICIGSFHPRVISSYASTDISTKSTTAIKGSPYRFPLLSMVFLILASLTICMDVEPNPGPISTATSKQSATDANFSDSSRTPLHQYTGLFNATKRIRLKLTRYKHHLLNYTFFKENYYIPASLYPSLPPFHTDNEKFTADGDTYHTLLLTDTSSYLSLNADTRSKSLPKNSRITWNFCETPIHRTHFYSTPINWIPWPLRLNLCWPTDVQKKPLVPAVLLTTISPPITSINTSITLMLVLMTYYLMLHITPLPQLSHANALVAKPNMPTFIWIILLLSTYPVALYLPTRYLSFHADSLSALLHDISTGRKFQPTFTTFLGACD